MRLSFKLWHHRDDGEEVPKDVTHVIVDESVRIIKKEAFFECKRLVCLIMRDNVKRIEAVGIP